MAAWHTEHTPEQIGVLKVLIVEAIEKGKPIYTAARLYSVDWKQLARWRAADPAWHQAIRKASEYRAIAFPVVYSRAPKRTPEEIAELKEMLPHLIAECRLPATKAIRELGIGYREYHDWRRDDPAFNDQLKIAGLHLTEAEADRLMELHDEITDPKRAMVAGKHLMWWLEMRNPAFRPKATAADDQPQLIGILQAAVNRLIEAVPVAPLPAPNCEQAPRAAIKVIDHEPSSS